MQEKKSNTELLSLALIAMYVDLMRTESEIKNSTLAQLKYLESNLVQLVRTYQPTQHVTIQEQKALLQEITQQTDSLIQWTYREIKIKLNDHFDQLIQTEIAITEKLFKQITGNTLNTTLTQEIVAQIESTSVLGATLSIWLDRQAGQLKQSFIDNINLAYTQNLNTEELASRIEGTRTRTLLTVLTEGLFKTIPNYINSIFETIHTQTLTLLQTAQHAAESNTQLLIYRQNSALIKGLYAQVTLDAKTSFICRPRAGMSWTLDGNPLSLSTDIKFPGYPPWHWNCRTIIVPILYGEEQPPQVSYEEWLNTKNEDVQKKILGTARYTLWKEKKISLNALADKTGTAITLARLKTKYNIN
jgi:hypothetical protein